MKKSTVIYCALILCSSSSYASLAHLTRNDINSFSENEAKESNNQQENQALKPSHEAELKLQKTIIEPTDRKESQIISEVEKRTQALSRANSPVAQEKKITQPTPSTYNHNQLSIQTQNTSGRAANTDQIISYINYAATLQDNQVFRALKPEYQSAMTMLNGFLMAVGSEMLEGQASIESQRELAKAIGCINSYRSETLSGLANKLINQHASMAPIGRVLQSSPKINSTYTHQCG